VITQVLCSEGRGGINSEERIRSAPTRSGSLVVDASHNVCVWAAGWSESLAPTTQCSKEQVTLLT